MTENRNLWMDVAKGLAVVLMVLGHGSLPNLPSRFIWSFHMPLFFIASGWMTNWRAYLFQTFLFRRSKNLLLPFLVYSTTVLLIYEYLIGEPKLLHWLMHGWETYALWFIPVLFLASLIGRLVYMLSNKYMRYVVMVVLLIVGCTLSYYHISLPWSLSSVPFACFLVLVGTELKQIQKLIDSPRCWMLAGGLGLSLGISLLWRLDMCSNSILPIIPLMIGAVAGTLMMFTLSSYIVRYTRFCSHILQAAGRETYLIVAYSQIIIILMNQYLAFGSGLKYSILVVVLAILVIVKNTMNKVLRTWLL